MQGHVQVKSRKLPVIDQFRPRHSKRMYGVPCGGMGAGTIGRQVHLVLWIRVDLLWIRNTTVY